MKRTKMMEIPKKVRVAPPPPAAVTPTTTTIPPVNVVLGEDDMTVETNTVVPLSSDFSLYRGGQWVGPRGWRWRNLHEREGRQEREATGVGF